MTKPDTVTIRLSINDATRMPAMLWAVLDAIDACGCVAAALRSGELPDGAMDAIDRLALTIHHTTKDLHNERAR